MANGLPEKMSVTIVLAAIRCLQQRDCPGFSPDSLFIRFDVSIIRNQFGAKVMDLLKILFHFLNISNDLPINHDVCVDI